MSCVHVYVLFLWRYPWNMLLLEKNAYPCHDWYQISICLWQGLVLQWLSPVLHLPTDNSRYLPRVLLWNQLDAAFLVSCLRTVSLWYNALCCHFPAVSLEQNAFTLISTGAPSFITMQEETSIKLAPVLSSLFCFTWNWKRLHLLWGNIMRALWGLATPFLFIWSLNHLVSFASHHPAIHAKKTTIASNFPMQSHRRKPAVISVLAAWIQPWGLGWKSRTVWSWTWCTVPAPSPVCKQEVVPVTSPWNLSYIPATVSVWILGLARVMAL